MGYLRSAGIDTPIEHCKDEGDELEARIARLAARVEGVHYLSMRGRQLFRASRDPPLDQGKPRECGAGGGRDPGA